MLKTQVDISYEAESISDNSSRGNEVRSDVEKKPWSKVRRSFLESELLCVPFQLFPGATYPDEVFEKSFEWQAKFIEGAKDVPRVSVCVWVNDKRTASLFVESLAIQSMRPHEVILLADADSERIVEECLERLREISLNGRAFILEENQTTVDGFQKVCGEVEGDYCIFAGDRMMLHPSCLYVLTKQVKLEEHSSDKPESMYYFNSLHVDGTITNLTGYVRRSQADQYSILGRNIFGNAFALTREAMQAVASNRELTGKAVALSEMAWFVGLAMGEREATCRNIPLAIVVETYVVENSTKRVIDPLSAGLISQVESYCKHFDIPLKELKGSDADFISLYLNGYRNSSFSYPQIEKATGKVQVVIPFYNKSDLTIDCLKSIAKQDSLEEIEVCLVNNNSSESERKKVEKFIASYSLANSTTLVDDEEYFNYARVNNLAANSSSAPYVLLLNNDVVLDKEGSIDELRNCCSLPGVGVVGGGLYYGEGERIQSLGINFAVVGPMNVNSNELYGNVFREVDGVTFAMAMIKREAFDCLGGLDEFSCPNGFGDALFCHKVKENGWKVLYSPRAFGYHKESASRGRMSEELELLELDQQGVPIPRLHDDFRCLHQPVVQPLVGRRAGSAFMHVAGAILNRPKLLKVADAMSGKILKFNHHFWTIRAKFKRD